MLNPRFMIRWLGALYFYRVPILLSATLTVLWWNDGTAMVSGLYVGDRPQCFELAFVLTVLAGQTLMLIHLLQRHRQKRLGMSPEDAAAVDQPGANRFGVPACLLALIPWLLNGVALYRANGPIPWPVQWTADYARSLREPLSILGALLAGALVASAILLLLYRVNHSADGSPRKPSTLSERWSRKIAKVIERVDVDGGPGFVEDHKLRDNLLDATLFAALSLLIYLVFAWIPTTALLYVLLWLSLAGWTFGFLCFWLDRYRVPFVTISLLWGVAMTNCSRNAHYYFLEPGPSGTQPATVTDVFKGPDGKTLPHVVIVSAEGGGIHAAAWTARVLAGLAGRLDPKDDFMNSIRLLSGASGGSVGNLFFQALYDKRDQLANKGCWHDVVLASRNGAGLDDIAHGIVYHDIRRPLLPYALYSNRDRGNSLELAWREMLDGIGGVADEHQTMHPECAAAGRGEQTIDSLSADAQKGLRPLLIFNSTEADTGWPMAIANFQFTEENGIRVFHKRYGKDLKLTTAVRLSASFPYVLPSPRPIICAHPGLCVVKQEDPMPDLAVIDGGLYDNYGVAGAYQALSQATGGFKNYAAPVLWLQIRSAPYHDEDDASFDQSNPLASGPAGPLFSLFQVRGTGQAKRADWLTTDAWLRSNGMLKVVMIAYPVDPQPLSWKLTKRQANDIDDGWFKPRIVNKQPVPSVVDATVPQVEFFFKGQ
jgi:hypothetical protein